MKRFMVVLLSAVIICYIGCYIALLNIPVTPVYNEIAVKDTYYMQKEAVLIDFINEYLTGEHGEILCNLKGAKGYEAVLSESLGLMMNYCLIKDRKDLFNEQFVILRDHLLVDGRYIKWKKGEKVNCNAAIDDFRIARALLEAGERWKNSEYFNIAGFIQEGIYNSQLADGNLCELYDFENSMKKYSIPLCYLDFYTMHRMEIFNSNWQKAWNKGLTTVKNGRINEYSPFFHDCFNYKTGLYYMDDRYGNKKDACLIYTLYTAIHLLEVNEDMEYLTGWLKKEVKKGKIYACYNPVTLEPASDTESTAVYALAAVYCRNAGESELFEVLLDKMLKFMVGNKESRYYGGFGNEETGDFYSFDNLTALWALALSQN